MKDQVERRLTNMVDEEEEEVERNEDLMDEIM